MADTSFFNQFSETTKGLFLKDEYGSLKQSLQTTSFDNNQDLKTFQNFARDSNKAATNIMGLNDTDRDSFIVPIIKWISSYMINMNTKNIVLRCKRAASKI